MATFIPGITDIFPAPPTFKPDWNRVERGLMLRSAAYAEGARKVKSLYDSVFQSPMLRDANIERRDAYLKEITQGLKNASALDLSIMQNQQAAINLFEPLQSDQDIVKDIMWTKSYYQQAAKAEQMRNSSDPETRRQYWDTGMKYLQYQAEEFKNTDNQTARSMGAAKYIPNVDLVGLANKMYKEMGIEVKQDVINGGYIWTKKNGDLAVPLTQSMVNTMFANDPAIKDMLRVQAYVQRKDFVKNNAAKFGSEEAAEKIYLTELLDQLSIAQQDQSIVDSDDVRNLRARKDAWEKVINTTGIIPGSADHKKYLEDLELLKAAEAAAEQSRNQSTGLSTIDMGSLNDIRAAVDNAVMAANYTTTANKIATVLAYKNAESTAKADPFSLARLNSQLALNRSIVLENLRQVNKIDFLDQQLRRGIKPGSNNKKSPTETEKDKKKRAANDANDLFGGTPMQGGNNILNRGNVNEDESIRAFLEENDDESDNDEE
jgi:hypothetical protein